MVNKYRNTQPQPSHWKVTLSCNHTHVLPNDEIKHKIVDSKYAVRDIGETETTMLCDSCLRHAPGSCDKGNIIHRVLFATPMFSHEAIHGCSNTQQSQQEQEQ